MMQEGLTFDDVLLKPRYSDIESRSQIDLTLHINKPGFSSILKHPIIPANMKTVIEHDMAQAVFESGGLAFIHRFMPIDDQIKILTNLHSKHGKTIYNHIGLSVGIKPIDKENIHKAVNSGVEILCIDIAHGDSENCVKMTEWISKTYPNILLVAGNVATGDGASRLWKAGADIVKSGVGPGSLCSTRIETGNGVPQLTALMEVAEAQKKAVLLNSYDSSQRTFPFISDGGCKNAGDIVKALCFADMVMTGNLFAGCEEAPGNRVEINGVMYKEYVGSSTYKPNHIEGVAALVPYKGTHKQVMDHLLDGLRSGLSYQGVHNLRELRKNHTFIRMTGASLKESHPHDVKVIK